MSGNGGESDADRGTDGDARSAALAAIVPKERSEATLGALREADRYDDARRIREHDDGAIAIPVTGPIPPGRRAALGIRAVVEQADPEPRPTGLDDLLRERGWTDAEVDAAPGSWAVIGTVVLVDVPADCPDEEALGEALLDLHREADTVLAREGIEGPTRDPSTRVIAGAGDTETVHAEHGVRYALDLATVMFSPGNAAERARMGALVAAGRDAEEPVATLRDDPAATHPDDADVAAVPDRVTDLDPADGGELDSVGGPAEHVFDMFAGAGYFALPAAIAGAEVTAAEIDPDTFRYLIENAQLNDVGERVAAYRADCREVAEVVEVDRAIMGHWDAHEYLDSAFEAVRDGGVIHYHAVAPEADLPDRPRERLASAATDAERSIAVEDLRRVKSYGEGVWHVVADARVQD